MRTALAVVLAVILGVALGVAVAALRIAIVPWEHDSAGVRRETPAGGVRHGSGPRVLVDQPEYQFGTMDSAGQGSHDFIFSNQGSDTLELASGGTSCRCTVASIQHRTIAPGGSGTVTVRWTADEQPGPYSHTVAIRTNDPTQPTVTLTVSGRVAKVVRAVPPELIFGRVSLTEPATGELRLLCYLDQPLDILSCKMVDGRDEEHFEIGFEPLTADQLKEAHEGDEDPGQAEQPGEEEQEVETETPRYGYLLRVTLKPGLPLGRFRRTILVQTNQESLPTLKVPVAGTIVGDISIVGPGWDDEAGVLTLGTLSSAEETQRQLLLVTRGPHSKEVQFELVRTVPDLLQVDQQGLKQTTPIGSGTVTQTPLIIRIPRGSRRANYLGPEFGQILIGTNHPDIPLLRIRVLFAVEG